MSKEHIVPLNLSSLNSERVQAHIPFPVWVNDKKININLKRVDLLLQLGGIRKLKISGKSERVHNMYRMKNIAGIDPSGTLSAEGEIIKEKAKAFKTQYDRNNGIPMLHNGVWVNAEVKINMALLEEEILDRGGNLRETKDWANSLDKIVRAGIREIGTTHLLTGHNRFNKFMALSVIAHNTVMNLTSIGSYPFAEINSHTLIEPELLFQLIWNSFSWNMMTVIADGVERKGKGHRISIQPGYEIDRALALQILARTTKLIEAK